MPVQKKQECWIQIRIILQPDQCTPVLRNVRVDKERILSIIQGLGEELLAWGEGVDFRVAHSGSGITYAAYGKPSDREPISKLRVMPAGEVSYMVRSPAVHLAASSSNFAQLIEGYLSAVLAFGGELYREYEAEKTVRCTVISDGIALCASTFPSQSMFDDAKRREICNELMPQVREQL